ncbi:MAG: TSUP family transporter, partial [Paracoccaceae bacterium]
EFFITASAAVVFAGVSKGGFGSGAAFVAAAGLATVIDPGQAIGLMLPLLMLMDVTSLKPYWGQWLKKESLYLCLGGMPGVALGVWFYSLADADMLRLLIGVISLLFVLWQAIQAFGFAPRAEEKLPPWAGGLAGVAAGFTSFVSHAGGPPAAIYLLSAKPSKTEYQALPYSFLGLFTWETLKLDLMLAPFALLGVWLGVRAHHLISERFFFLLTYVLLVLTGVRLIWVALS